MDLKKSITKYIEIIRENFSIIIAIPTILGGLWQVFQLIFISPIFLRFFSLSQLISDGLFVTLLIIIVIIIPYIIALSISTFFTKHSSLVKLILSIFFTFILIIAFFLDYNEKKFNLFTLMFFSYAFLQSYLFNFSAHYRAPKFSKFDKIIMTTQIILGICISLIDIIQLGSEFSKSSNDIENIKYVNFKIREKYPCAKVEYFNDKYIFIEKDSVCTSKTYLIEKFDALTETH